MSQSDKYELWFEHNEASLRDKFIESHIGIFSEWAYDVWINIQPEPEDNGGSNR